MTNMTMTTMTNNTMCPSHASPAEPSSAGQWRRISSPAISATKQKYDGKLWKKCKLM